MIIVMIIILFFIAYKCFQSIQKKKEEEAERSRRIKQWVQSDEYKEYEAKKDLEEKQKRVREKDCYGVPFETPPAVTGDYFEIDFRGGPSYPYGYSGGKEYDCQFRNSASCAYCCRRQEIHLENEYYYGNSKHCTYYTSD